MIHVNRKQHVPSADECGRAMSGVPGVSPSDDSSRDDFALPARRDSRCRRCLQCRVFARGG